MRILFLGDVVGSPGRRALVQGVKRLEERVDFVIANCENSAHGTGVTSEIARALLAGPCDVLTSGNHIWAKRDILPMLAEEPRLLRPANYPGATTPGRGHVVVTAENGVRVGVLNLEGRVFMKPLDCPFVAADRLIEELRRETAVVIVDMHCEATSEKQAMGHFLDGRASAVLGTHTHVQTADERLLPGGTAFITDAGMTGPHGGVIGMPKANAIARFVSQRATEHAVDDGDVMMQGVIVEVDESSGRALRIERVQERID